VTAPPPETMRGTRCPRILLALALVFLVLGSGAPALADAYLRVIAQEAPVHTGPGAHYRHIYRASRGEVFPVLERGTRGYWFRVELEDGTTGWILGDLVFPFEVVDKDTPGLLTRAWRRTRRALFGPTPVPYSHAEISFSSGVLAREGIFLLRPGWLVDRHFAIEGFLGLSPRATNNLFLVGAGWTLRMAPSAAVGPYLNAALGAAHLRPKADNFLDERKTLTALSTGGGFEVTLKKQIIVRLDFRNWTLFDSDEATNAQEYSGGLAFFF
jgi:hypothetical protein